MKPHIEVKLFLLFRIHFQKLEFQTPTRIKSKSHRWAAEWKSDSSQPWPWISQMSTHVGAEFSDGIKRASLREKRSENIFGKLNQLSEIQYMYFMAMGGIGLVIASNCNWISWLRRTQKLAMSNYTLCVLFNAFIALMFLLI